MVGKRYLRCEKDFRDVLRRWMASFGRVQEHQMLFHFTDQESEAEVEFAFEPPIASGDLFPSAS